MGRIRGLPLVGDQLKPTRDYTILEQPDSHCEAGSAVRTGCSWHKRSEPPGNTSEVEIPPARRDGHSACVEGHISCRSNRNIDAGPGT